MQCQSIIWVKQVYLKSQYNCRAQGFPSSKLLGAWVHLSGEWSIRVETCKQTGWEGEMRKLNQNIPSSCCYLYSHCGNAACEDIEVGLWTYQKRRSPFRQCKQWKQEEIETKSWCYPELDLFEKGLITRQEDEDRASTALKNNVLHMLHVAAWPAVPTITKARSKFQQRMKRQEDKGKILHVGQNKDAGRSKPEKPCCSVGGRGWLTAQAQKCFLQTSLESLWKRVECRFPWSRPTL